MMMTIPAPARKPCSTGTGNYGAKNCKKKSWIKQYLHYRRAGICIGKRGVLWER